MPLSANTLGTYLHEYKFFNAFAEQTLFLNLIGTNMECNEVKWIAGLQLPKGTELFIFK
jgi:hypothetical protein